MNLDALLQKCRTKVAVKSSQNMLKLNAMSNSQMSEAASASPKVKQMDAESAVEDCSIFYILHCFERKPLLRILETHDAMNMPYMWIMNVWIWFRYARNGGARRAWKWSKL